MGFWPSRRNKELSEELQTHLEIAARERMERGQDRDSAERFAHRELGNLELIKEITRDMWSWRWIEPLLQDARYGLRVLRKNPGYAGVAILSLALGIGVNTAIFSLIDAVMLKSLPVRDPQQLVTIGDPARTGGISHGSGGRSDLFSYPFFNKFRERDQVFSDVYATGRSQHLGITSSEGEQSGKVTGRFVSGNYFDLLGVVPVLGRVFTDAETRVPGCAPTAVISYGYWQRQFARDKHIVGSKLVVNGAPFTVIGVAPAAFTGDIVGVPIDIWFPLTMQAQANPGYNFLDDPHTEWLLLMGRLKPGITVAQAAASTNLLAKHIFREQYAAKTAPDELHSLLRQIIPVASGAKGFSRMRRDFAVPLLMLMAIVMLVLLICCANVANLQLARAANRSREMNVRLAVGAGRGRLLRQLMTESLLLAFAGGASALAFSQWASRLLLRFTSQDSRLPLELQVDGPVLAFTATAACLSALLFGLLPALQSSRTDLVSGLRETRAGQSLGASRAFGRTLIVAQVCLSMLLLAGAGLFLRTLANLQNVDVGYRRKGLVLAELDFTMAGYRGAAVKRLAERLMDNLQSAPGVEAVTVSENGLFSGTDSDTVSPIDNYTPRIEADRLNHSDRVGPNYFAIVGTPVLAGRGITERDGANASKVAVVNESLARFYFGHSSPIGRHIFDDPSRKGVVYTIVGVVRDAKQSKLRDPAPRRFYLSYLQAIDSDPIDAMNLEIRMRSGAAASLDDVRKKIASVDPKLSIIHLSSADSLINDELDQERMVAKLSVFFGALALVLAAIGLYGVMSYLTARRTTEIGIRMALGAVRQTVVGMMLRETFMLVALGLAIGALFSLALAALLHKMLFGLSAFELLPILGAALVIATACAFATFLPAWRASRVDPTVALRYE